MSTAITYITTTVFVVSARSTRRGSKHVYKKMEFVMPSLIEEKEKRNHKKKRRRFWSNESAFFSSAEKSG
jgi:hypothetical protein